VLRNAVTWGAAWAVAGGVLVTVVGLFNAGPGIGSLVERLGMAVLSGIAWGVRFGIAGAVIGTVFASLVGLRYRGRRVSDINPIAFALLGAVVGGVGVPLYLQTMNVLFGGGPIAWGLVTDDALWATPFGAAAAAGLILLARRADAGPQATSPDRLGGVDDLDALPAPRPLETPIVKRVHSARL
jgi:hypothetical protein